MPHQESRLQVPWAAPVKSNCCFLLAPRRLQGARRSQGQLGGARRKHEPRKSQVDPGAQEELLLAPPGSSWLLLALLGSSWLLLAPPGSSWLFMALHGSYWGGPVLLQAPTGGFQCSSWLLLQRASKGCSLWGCPAFSAFCGFHVSARL